MDFDTTENLYIEGDNLEVLKLLQETYLGKIKMIYIDPPYNTGSDFVYADNFLFYLCYHLIIQSRPAQHQGSAPESTPEYKDIYTPDKNIS